MCRLRNRLAEQKKATRTGIVEQTMFYNFRVANLLIENFVAELVRYAVCGLNFDKIYAVLCYTQEN